MKIGCCGGIAQAQALKEAGFEYLEVNVQQLLKGDEDDAAWAKQAPDVDALPLPLEAANCLVPGHHKLVGPTRDLATLKSYMQRVTKRAKQLGISRLVLGSGGARQRPDDVPYAVAFEQIAEFARVAGDCAAAHDIVIVIEHLNGKECNMIVKLEEEARLIAAAAHPAVAALVDSYHFGLESEGSASFALIAKDLQHAHVAEPVNRVEPGAHGSSGFDFVGFFADLRRAGYDQRVSFEGKWSAGPEVSAPRCVAAIREAWDAAGDAI